MADNITILLLPLVPFPPPVLPGSGSKGLPTGISTLTGSPRNGRIVNPSAKFRNGRDESVRIHLRMHKKQACLWLNR